MFVSLFELVSNQLLSFHRGLQYSNKFLWNFLAFVLWFCKDIYVLTHLILARLSTLKGNGGTSVVVRWLGVCFTMQETQVWSLVQEPKIPHASRKVSPCTATAVPSPRACAPQQKEPLHREACAPQLERSPCSLRLLRARTQQPRTRVAKKKKTKNPGNGIWMLAREQYSHLCPYIQMFINKHINGRTRLVL